MATAGPPIYKSKRDEWVERNPLRMWRKANKITLMKLAPQIECSILAVQLWESGSNRPNPKNMDKLIRIMRDPTLPQRWTAWAQSCPRWT